MPSTMLLTVVVGVASLSWAVTFDSFLAVVEFVPVEEIEQARDARSKTANIRLFFIDNSRRR